MGFYFLKGSEDVPAPGLINYMFVDFEFERRQLLSCRLTRKSGDWERVPKLSDTMREQAILVIWTVMLQLVAKLPGMLTSRSLLSPHSIGRSDGQREHVDWCGVPTTTFE